MGCFHTVKLADMEMGTHQHRSTVQVFPKQNPQVEETADRREVEVLICLLTTKKTEKHLYQPKTTPAVIDVPEMVFIMVDGKGNPNTSEEYKSAIEILWRQWRKLSIFLTQLSH